MKRPQEIILVNGTQPIETIRNVHWIADENAFFGKDDAGDGWYAWNVQQENTGRSYASDFRRARG